MAHLAEAHPFVTINHNHYVLTLEEKFYLLEQLELYTNLLLDPTIQEEPVEVMTDATIEFRKVTHAMNSFATITPKMIANHHTFRKRAIESGLIKKATSSWRQLLDILDEFQRFMNLGQPPVGGNFCPSMVIDLVWHAAMMNGSKYIAMCHKFLGSNGY